MATNGYENLASWYFRLNGCLTIPNFVLHPEVGRNQLTDADLIAVRFPHRREVAGRQLYDDELFTKETNRLQVFFAEVSNVRWSKCKRSGRVRGQRKLMVDG
jgi:hypothetical protein